MLHRLEFTRKIVLIPQILVLLTNATESLYSSIAFSCRCIAWFSQNTKVWIYLSNYTCLYSTPYQARQVMSNLLNLMKGSGRVTLKSVYIMYMYGKENFVGFNLFFYSCLRAWFQFYRFTGLLLFKWWKA